MKAPEHPAGTPHGTGDREPLTISLSAIIASIWAGVWGFEWAATHLNGDELFVAVITGLVFGTGLTVYAVERSFNAVRRAEKAGRGAVLYSMDDIQQADASSSNVERKAGAAARPEEPETP